jgi:hypothetical protein
MKRNETPLNASNFLDAICSPITLTGNYALPAQSPHGCGNTFPVKTKTPALLNHFIPAQRSLSGYNNMIETFVMPSICVHVKPIE